MDGEFPGSESARRIICTAEEPSPSNAPANEETLAAWCPTAYGRIREGALAFRVGAACEKPPALSEL